MNATMEKMTNENTPKMETTMYGDFLHKDNSKECAILVVIKNQKIVLEEEFAAAKENYAGKLLNDKYNPETYNAELKCRIIEGKLEAVTKIQNNVEDMLSTSCTM